jgi:ABC-type glycerol-3-phosphate transport system substrate-binding protein
LEGIVLYTYVIVLGMARENSATSNGTKRIGRREFLAGSSTAGVALAAGCAGTGGNGNGGEGETGNGNGNGGGGETGNGDSNGGGEGVEEITVMMENVYDTTIIQNMIDDFESDADFSVTIEAFPYGTMNETITTQLRSSSSNYDVIIVDNPWVGNFVEGELIQPLDERIENSDSISTDVYVDSMWNTVGAVDGTAYMLPFYNYGLSMLYREDIAEEHGVEVPDDGMEMADYLEACAQITEDTGDDFYGAAMQAQRGYKITEEWTNYLYAEDGAILDGGNVVLGEGDSAVSALDNYIENLDTGAPDAAEGWGFNQARQLMQNGNAFSMITYNWMLGRLSDTEVGDNLAIAEVPGSKSVLGAWGWAIPSNLSEARSNAAWEFLEWVESPETRKARCMEGGSPTSTDTLSDDELLNEFPEYYPVVEGILSDAEPLPSIVGGNEMIQTVGTQLSQAVAGNKSSQQAITDATSQLQDIAGN